MATLNFKTIRWKNLLATGDNWLTLNFQESSSTLIVGDSGSGKTTICEAISFCLFNKAHRNINKAQLINSINNKTCVVETEFKIGNNEFKVIRGLKPNIFEIYRNDKLIPQTSTIKEYQIYLEQNILKFNYKTFHQIVVLGASTFIPFMCLPPQQRRQIVEDILDINIFSKMNILLKEQYSELKKSMIYNDSEISGIKHKKKTQEKYINDLKNLNEDMINDKKKLIFELNNNGKKISDNINALNIEIENKRLKYDNLKNKYDFENNNINDKIKSINHEINTLNKSLHFFNNNNICPTCTQNISNNLKNIKAVDIEKSIKDFNNLHIKYNNKLLSINKNLIILNTLNSDIIKDIDKVTKLNTNIKSIHMNINNINNDIINIMKKTEVINKAKKELDIIVKKCKLLKAKKKELIDTNTYNILIHDMLKDSGIKAQIIKQYIPIMNKLINDYLKIMDFYVSFHLDESFNEVIKSRNYDIFTYTSFSEGEKQRINLALLFTWRDIARMKNSISTNLLIFDEILDKSLDPDSVENVLKILHSLNKNTNLFVISHKRELLEDKFDRLIKFTKHKNFTHMIA